QEFIESNKNLVIVIVAMLPAAALGFVIHSIIGVTLLLLALAATAGLSYMSFVVSRFDHRPSAVETPEAAVREYVAAVRIGLFYRARLFMAFPEDVEPVPVNELIEKGRAPLGVRFNSLAP